MRADEIGQIALQLDDSGNPTHRYLWGEAVDQILADEIVDDGGSEDILWTLTDHQNTVRDLAVYDEVLDETSVVNHIAYDAFGNVTAETNAAVDHLFGYTGRPFDKTTGLQNNLHRWYDASVGRWLSEDPIGIEGGDANLYRYVDNEPNNGIDASGLFWDETWAGLIGFGKGFLGQGPVNIVNGLQDTVIGIANLPARGVNSIAWVEEKLGILPEDSIHVPYIPSPDWSRGLVTHEGGTGWGDTHNWSKGLGAGAAEILTGAAIAKIMKARQVARAAEEWLGKGSRAWRNKAGDVIVESEDGLRQIRFDFKNTSPHKNPHTHVIEFKQVKNKKMKVFEERIFPRDLTPE